LQAKYFGEQQYKQWQAIIVRQAGRVITITVKQCWFWKDISPKRLNENAMNSNRQHQPLRGIESLLSMNAKSPIENQSGIAFAFVAILAFYNQLCVGFEKASLL